MPKLFLISGTGADERLFDNLALTGYELKYVHWIKPDKNNTLSDYATQLIHRFEIKTGDNVLGVSLGGLVTVEIAKQIALRHAIVLSSIKSLTEVPWHMRLFKLFPVHTILSGRFLIWSGFLIRPFFGKMSDTERKLFYDMLNSTDPDFIKWAVNAIVTWNGKPAKSKVDHIIGGSDMIFSNRNISGAVVIPKGNHMMIYNRGAQLSPIIQNILNG